MTARLVSPSSVCPDLKHKYRNDLATMCLAAESLNITVTWMLYDRALLSFPKAVCTPTMFRRAQAFQKDNVQKGGSNGGSSSGDGVLSQRLCANTICYDMRSAFALEDRSFQSHGVLARRLLSLKELGTCSMFVSPCQRNQLKWMRPAGQHADDGDDHYRCPSMRLGVGRSNSNRIGR
jgi:hypothetical protein